MIEMYHGETTIRVLAYKVDEMLAKGWELVHSGSESVEIIEDEDLDDGES